jgi:hypothetical protein
VKVVGNPTLKGGVATVTVEVEAHRACRAAFELSVGGFSGTGIIVVERAEPHILEATSIVGGVARIVVPIRGGSKQTGSYFGHFEPPQRAFRLSKAKGWIEEGTKTFPVQLTFRPTSSANVDTLLIFDLEDKRELVYHVFGSVGGFGGVQRGQRTLQSYHPKK